MKLRTIILALTLLLAGAGAAIAVRAAARQHVSIELILAPAEATVTIRGLPADLRVRWPGKVVPTQPTKPNAVTYVVPARASAVDAWHAVVDDLLPTEIMALNSPITVGRLLGDAVLTSRCWQPATSSGSLKGIDYLPLPITAGSVFWGNLSLEHAHGMAYCKTTDSQITDHALGLLKVLSRIRDGLKVAQDLPCIVVIPQEVTGPQHDSQGPVPLSSEQLRGDRLRGVLLAVINHFLRATTRSACPVIEHGVAWLLAESLAKELDPDSAHFDWHQERLDYYVDSAPHPYDIWNGPYATHPASFHRGWRYYLAPLVVEHALQYSGLDASQQELIGLLGPNAARTSAYSRLRSTIGSLADAQPIQIKGLVKPMHDYPLIQQVSSRPAEARFSLYVTGNTAGYLETCGCAVNQAGGAARRATALLGRKPDTIAIDLGCRYSTQPMQTTEKLRKHRQLIDTLNERDSYDVLCADKRDLWTSESSSMASLVACNLTGARGFREKRVTRDRVIICGVSRRNLRSHSDPRSLIGSAVPSASVSDVWDPLLTLRSMSQKASVSEYDCVIVATQANIPLIHRMIDENSWIDMVVTCNDASYASVAGEKNPAYQVTSHTYLNVPVLVARMDAYGIMVIHCTLLDNNRWGAAFERIWLTERVPDDIVSRSLITDYYKSIADDEDWERPPLLAGNAQSGYVGSAVCKNCHAAAYGHWSSNRHGQAFNTLLSVQRDFVPECVQCHVVGMGERTGFSRSASHDLRGVGCEMCHGGGAAHVSAPSRANIRRSVDEETCIACHDSKHSPSFDYSKYVRRIMSHCK